MPGSLRKQDPEFKASLSYMVRCHLGGKKSVKQTGDKESNIAPRIQQRNSHNGTVPQDLEESIIRQPWARDTYLGTTPLLRKGRAMSYGRTKSTAKKKKKKHTNKQKPCTAVGGGRDAGETATIPVI